MVLITVTFAVIYYRRVEDIQSEEFWRSTAVTEIDQNAIVIATTNAEATETVFAATRQAEQTIVKQTVDTELVAGTPAAREATVTAMPEEILATAGLVTLTPPPSLPPPISGRLAFPIDDGAGRYDVHIVSMPAGDQLGILKGARQPHFRWDGARLLVNAQGSGFGENVLQITPNGTIERAASGAPTDSHPVYSPAGGRIAYSSPQLAIGGNSFLFVQCGTIPPAEEHDKICIDIARFGVLVPEGQIGEIHGSHPVWAVNDLIYFNGCDSWAGGGSCGLFAVGSWANKRSSNGETPRKIADGTSVIPTDTKGGWIAYHSRESGDWEAYVMGLDGSGVVNISNSPNASDGLPTISPAGQWVAFASDREGGWAVYVAPSTGGTATKVFDFPKDNPWGANDRDWTNERMSWGPGPVVKIPTPTPKLLPTPTS
jgi:hypothetical protein